MPWVTKHSAETYAPPDPPREYSRAEKRRNWWHYHWAWVLLAAAGAVMAASILYDTLLRPRPDLQVACVTRTALPDEVLAALERELDALASDANGDGRVMVQVTPYVLDFTGGDAFSAQADMAARASLVADIGSGAFTVVLLDDPESFQAEFEALAPLDAAPAQFAYRWQDCPVPAGFDLGRYRAYTAAGDEIEADGAQAVAGLYIARRLPMKEDPAGEALWQALTAGALPPA